MPDEATPLLVSTREAARLLGVSAWTARKLINEGVLETRVVLRQRRVVLASVHRAAQAEAA